MQALSILSFGLLFAPISLHCSHHVKPGCDDLLETCTERLPVESQIGDRSGFTGLHSSLYTYFSHLSTYSPFNFNGSCGFVSFIQYLLYYDTFWNDGIIPEVYEAYNSLASDESEALSDSPGVSCRSFSSGGTALYNDVVSYSSTDLQLFLIGAYNQALNNSPSEYTPSIGMWDYHYLLDALFPSQAPTFYYTSYSDFNDSPNSPTRIQYFDSYVQNVIASGHPVLLHIGIYDDNTGFVSDYHSVVAYGYTTGLGPIFHLGQGIGTEYSTLGTGFVILQAGYADFSGTAEYHSNNYYYDGHRFCGCGEHVHYFGSYTSLNSSFHSATCYCGATDIQPHHFIYIHHIRMCGECDYVE